MLQNPLLVSLLFITTGALVIATVYGRIDHLRHLKKGVHETPVDNEWQAVRGVIHAEDGTLTAPVTGRPAVALDYTVKRRVRRATSTQHSSGRYKWRTVADEEEFTPFTLETADGLVDVGNNPNFRYESDRQEATTIRHSGLLSDDDDASPAMSRFVGRRDNIEASGRQRYTEQTILDGDEVVVYGYYDKNPKGRVIRGDGDFPIIGLTEGAVLGTIAKPIAIRGLLGGLLILMGIGVPFL